MKELTNLPKDEQISLEKKKLKRIFKEIPKNKMAVVEGLISEAAFMRATLNEAREMIDREGIVEQFEQGSQNFLREHPATKVYNTMINRYTTVCKQLLDLLPEKPAPEAEDELLAFIRRGRK